VALRHDLGARSPRAARGGDQQISGGWCSHGGAEARRKQHEETTAGQKGNWRVSLTSGNRGQVKRRVHARAHARTCASPPAPRPSHPLSPLPPLPPSPSLLLPPQKKHPPLLSPQTQTADSRFFYLCSLHIGIRQELPALELGDLGSVASPRGSLQLVGGLPAIFCAVRFLY
jgi:hypothetical protein